MASHTNLATAPQSVAEKLAAEIQRLENEKNDPSLTSPLAPFRDQIVTLHDDLKQSFAKIAELLTASGAKATPYTVSRFYSAARKRRAAHKATTGDAS